MNDINVFTHEYVNNRLKPYRLPMGGIAVPVNTIMLEDIYWVTVKENILYDSTQKKLHLVAKRLEEKINNLISNLPEKEYIVNNLIAVDQDYLSRFQSEKPIMLFLTEAEAAYISVALMFLNGVPRVNYCIFQRTEYEFINVDDLANDTDMGIAMNTFIDYKFLFYAGLAAVVGYRDRFQTIEAKMFIGFLQEVYGVLRFEGEPTYEDNCYQWILRDAPSFCCKYNLKSDFWKEEGLLSPEEQDEYDSYFGKDPYEIRQEEKRQWIISSNNFLAEQTTDVFGINNMKLMDQHLSLSNKV